MRIILHIIRKELLQLRRDRRMLVMAFVSPIIQLLILGYAANLDVSQIPLVVSDGSKSRTSREFIARFSSSGTFKIVNYVDNIDDIDRWIDNGQASMALVLPRDFGDNLIGGRTTQVQVVADGSESNSAGIGLSYASVIVGAYSRNILLQTLSRHARGGISQTGPAVQPETRVWYNPAMISRNFMVPAVLAQVLMMMTMIFSSMGIVRERENGTMEQLIATPIKPWELILGKLTPFTGIALVDLALVLLVATFWFHVPLKGSLLVMFFCCLVFLLTTLGMGLLLSTISRTQQQAMLTAMFFVMMPMIMLSGFAFPIENMPKVIQPVTYLMPLRYFLVIVRGIFLKGVGLRELWPQVLALFVMGLAIFAVSVTRFRKRLE